jgi:predicted nuclease of predicted toxin-antitoxin system
VTFSLDHDVPADVARVLRHEGHGVSELRDVLPVAASELEVLRQAGERGLILVTCNRDDFLALVKDHPNPGLIVLIRRRSRQAECGKLLALLREAGESGIAGNVNFA